MTFQAAWKTPTLVCTLTTPNLSLYPVKIQWASNNNAGWTLCTEFMAQSKQVMFKCRKDWIHDSRLQAEVGAVADNHCIKLNIEGKIVKRVDHAKSLGLYIDKNLSWSKHIEEIPKKKFVWHRRNQKNKTIHFSKYCSTNIQSSYRAPFWLLQSRLAWNWKQLSDKLQKLQISRSQSNNPV